MRLDDLLLTLQSNIEIAQRRNSNKGPGHFVRTRIAAVLTIITDVSSGQLYVGKLESSHIEKLDELSKICLSILAEDQNYEEISNRITGKFHERKLLLRNEILEEAQVQRAGSNPSSDITKVDKEESLVHTSESDSFVPETEIEESSVSREEDETTESDEGGSNPSDINSFLTEEEFEEPGSDFVSYAKTIAQKHLKSLEDKEILWSEEIFSEEDEDPIEFDGPVRSLFRRNIEFANEYLEYVRTFPVLTQNEEILLSKRIEAGLFAEEKLSENRSIPKQYERELRWVARDGQRAKRDLVSCNLRLVYSIARTQPGLGLDILDVVQEGNIGLIRAVEKFDHKLGYKFSTYATWWIRQSMQRSVADQGRLIRIPVHVFDQVKKVAAARSRFLRQYDYLPSVEWLSTECSIEARKIHLFDLLPHASISLDEELIPGEVALQDLIVDETQVSIFNQVSKFELSEYLELLLGGLPWREAQILRLRYGIADGIQHTLDEIGQMFGVSRERIRQIENKTLADLTPFEVEEESLELLKDEDDHISIYSLINEVVPHRLTDGKDHPIIVVKQLQPSTKTQQPKTSAVDEYRNQQLPLEKLIDALEIASDKGDWTLAEELQEKIWELSQETNS